MFLAADLDMGSNWDTVVVSFSNGGKSTSNKDCKSGDRYFNNGASWHPIIGPFGKNEQF